MKKNKKILSVICITLACIVLVSGIVMAIIFGTINANSKERVMKYYNQQLAKYEKLVNDTDTKNFTLDSAVANKNLIYSNYDYLMEIFINDEIIKVQMKKNANGYLYLLKFEGTSFEDLSDKQYAMQLGTNNSFQFVYEIENSDIKTTYKSTEASFFKICDALKKYLPESYCAKNKYTNHRVYTTGNYDNTFIITGENTKLLFNKKYYFEENANEFIRLMPNDGKYIFKIPDIIK